MQNSKQKIFEILTKGNFISADSLDAAKASLYRDVEENYDCYRDYFREIGFLLELGDGFCYFSRMGELKQNIESKLATFAKWIDILDFLKTYDNLFSVGFQFRRTSLEERMGVDMELREKGRKLFRDASTNQAVAERVVRELRDNGFAECVSETDATYKVIAAFHYVENWIDRVIFINEENPDNDATA